MVAVTNHIDSVKKKTIKEIDYILRSLTRLLLTELQNLLLGNESLSSTQPRKF